MTSNNRNTRRLALPVSLAVGVALAAVHGSQLASYDVPPSLVIICALCVMGTFTSSLAHLFETLTTTTHRCREAGCDFRVRVRRDDAADNRRWQEIAAAHPRHI
ncbi:hypothetical protein [Streptomyces sp. NPDC053560]|uniref:hypothetical protein n=1 Tax=Streptomyces sp. NPDC053560 TaxID=3365711 RepID=UPI0037D51C47